MGVTLARLGLGHPGLSPRDRTVQGLCVELTLYSLHSVPTHNPRSLSPSSRQGKDSCVPGPDRPWSFPTQGVPPLTCPNRVTQKPGSGGGEDPMSESVRGLSS